MTTVEQRIAHCTACAGLFRLGRSVEAALDMIDVFESAGSHLDKRSPDVQQQWVQLLTTMLACQQAQDWLGLADYMQYELAELLEG